MEMVPEHCIQCFGFLHYHRSAFGGSWILSGLREWNCHHAVMTVPVLPFMASFIFDMEVIRTFPSLLFSR